MSTDLIQALRERAADGDREALAVLADYEAERGAHPSETEAVSVPLLVGSLGEDVNGYGYGGGYGYGDGYGGGDGYGDGDGDGDGDGYGGGYGGGYGYGGGDGYGYGKSVR